MRLCLVDGHSVSRLDGISHVLLSSRGVLNDRVFINSVFWGDICSLCKFCVESLHSRSSMGSIYAFFTLLVAERSLGLGSE